jgi:hypothetical protein
MKEKMQKLLLSNDLDDIKIGLSLLIQNIPVLKPRQQYIWEYKCHWPNDVVVVVTYKDLMLNTGRDNVVYSKKGWKHYSAIMNLCEDSSLYFHSRYKLLEL